MSVRVEEITAAECHARLIANLEDAELRVAEFLWLQDHACHMNCVEFEDQDREIALREADTWLFLLGGREGLGYYGVTEPPAGLVHPRPESPQGSEP